MQPYKIVQPYRKYFHKSRSFLFPALGIKRGSYITPEQTYISWGTRIRPADKKLIVLYDQQQSEAYTSFEKHALFKNPLFADYYPCENSKAAYIFTFEDMKEDWTFFLTGRYSQLSLPLKQKIRNFFGPSSNEYAYIDSFLYPQKYFDTYAELLGVDRDILMQVGELADPFDGEKENLKLKVYNLENSQINA